MTIDKAIEILTTLTKHDYWTMTPINSDSIRLGIEALKHYQEVRPLKVTRYYPLLPGETEN